MFAGKQNEQDVTDWDTFCSLLSNTWLVPVLGFWKTFTGIQQVRLVGFNPCLASSPSNIFTKPMGTHYLVCFSCFEVIMSIVSYLRVIFLFNSILFCLTLMKSRKPPPAQKLLHVASYVCYGFSHPLLPSSGHSFAVCSPQDQDHHTKPWPDYWSPSTEASQALLSRGQGTALCHIELSSCLAPAFPFVLHFPVC